MQYEVASFQVLYAIVHLTSGIQTDKLQVLLSSF